MIADLHTHSHHSDGLLAPEQLAQLASARGVTLLALTDHDTVAGCDSMRNACSKLAVTFVSGVEMSCTWRGQTLHILGLGIDESNDALQAQLSHVAELRRARMRLIGERLARRCDAELGLLALGIAEKTALPTRMHLARDIVLRGHAAHTGEAFRNFLVRGRPGYAPCEWPDLTTTLQAIQIAGGLASLAHPHRYQLSSGALRTLIGEFAANGGQAIECSSGPTSPNDVTRLAALASANGLLISGGSDFHDPANAWNTPGRFAKLPAGSDLLASRLETKHG